MTTLPLKLITRIDGFHIVDRNGGEEAGPYEFERGQRQVAFDEAVEDQAGLTRFYETNPAYLDDLNTKEMKKMSTETETVTAKTLEVTRDDAVALFVALGLKTAPSWDKNRLAAKLAALPDDYDADHAIGDEGAKATFDAVLGAVVNDVGILLVQGEKKAAVAKADPVAEDEGPVVDGEGAKAGVEAEAGEKAPKAEKPKKEPKAPKEPKEPKLKKEPVEKAPKTIHRGRPYFAGVVVKKHGFEAGVTDAMVAEVDALTNKLNAKESKYWLGFALQIVQGYIAE